MHSTTRTSITNQEHDLTFKLLAVGDSGVGKSSLLLRYSDDSFTPSFRSTIGVDFKLKSTHTQDAKTVKLQIWDTAGQERFRTITSSYYRGSHGVLVLFDITDEESFRNAREWLREVDRFSGNDGRGRSGCDGYAECVKMLVGAKLDLEHKRVVDEEVARSFAESMGVDYIEVSAKDSSNVKATFDRMVEKMYAGMVNSDLVGNEWKSPFQSSTGGGQGVLLSMRSDNKSSILSSCSC